MKVVVLASGRGSNLEALLDAQRGQAWLPRVSAVISDRRSAAALDIARAHAVATEVVRPRDFETRAHWDRALRDTLVRLTPDLVVLAGFMRILGDEPIARFEGKVINIHPSLLPAFPGRAGPADALRAGVRISGCTVHLVDLGVDTGPILAQAAVPVRQDDDPMTLHQRIQSVEHVLLPRVVHAVATGALTLGPPPRWHRSGEDVPRPLLVPETIPPKLP